MLDESCRGGQESGRRRVEVSGRVVGGPVALRLVEAGDDLHNTSVVLGPDGRQLARYRKVHVFGYESRERSLIAGGTELATFPIGGARAGMAVCYDLRFPELFRALADQVALYVVPATWPAARAEHWSTLLAARAIENQAFVVGCNAAGTNAGVRIGGRSAVIAPSGSVVAMAGDAPGRLDATIDLDDVAATRADFPALRDRAWPPSAPTARALASIPAGER